MTTASNNGFFKQFATFATPDLDNAKFLKKLEVLQTKLLLNYDIEVTPDGWRCTSKKQTEPGYVVTPASVLYVMRQFGIY